MKNALLKLVCFTLFFVYNLAFAQESECLMRIKTIEYIDDKYGSNVICYNYQNDKLISLTHNNKIFRQFEYNNNRLISVISFATETYSKNHNIIIDGMNVSWESELYYLDNTNIYKKKSFATDGVMKFSLQTSEINVDKPIYWEYLDYNTISNRFEVYLMYKDINNKEWSKNSILKKSGNVYTISNNNILYKTITFTYEVGISNLLFEFQE